MKQTIITILAVLALAGCRKAETDCIFLMRGWTVENGVTYAYGEQKPQVVTFPCHICQQEVERVYDDLNGVKVYDKKTGKQIPYSEIARCEKR